MEMPDTVLVARALAGDDNAFAELVRRHQSKLRGFLRRLTGDDFLADDLAQEAVAEAYENLEKFSGKSSFSTWLLGIGYNRFRHERRKRREVRLPENQPEPADEEADPGLRGTEEDVRAAVAALAEEERTAVELCYGHGLSHAEAAELLHCPVGSLKTRLARAKEKLKNHLSAYAARGEKEGGGSGR
jgi:RNA polymerase sigma-70 factor (ECF subfamily)